jgi:small neutral amino acid transporter SnatA (MarC family)
MIDFFVKKNDENSKTAFFLSLAAMSVLFLYVFQSLFAGTVFFNWWTIPEFSSIAAGTILTTLSGLYTINHGLVNNKFKKQIKSDSKEEDSD